MLDRLRESSRSRLFTVVGAAVGLLASIWARSYETFWLFFMGPPIFIQLFGMQFISIVFIILCTLVFGFIGYIISRFERVQIFGIPYWVWGLTGLLLLLLLVRTREIQDRYLTFLEQLWEAARAG